MGLPKSGPHSFRELLEGTKSLIENAHGVISHEKSLGCLVQGTTNSSSRGPKVEDEENVALASKGKVKKGASQGQGLNKGEKKKGLCKVTCLRCGEFGYYNTQCPKKKNKKGSNRVQL